MAPLMPGPRPRGHPEHILVQKSAGYPPPCRLWISQPLVAQIICLLKCAGAFLAISAAIPDRLQAMNQKAFRPAHSSTTFLHRPCHATSWPSRHSQSILRTVSICIKPPTPPTLTGLNYYRVNLLTDMNSIGHRITILGPDRPGRARRS